MLHPACDAARGSEVTSSSSASTGDLPVWGPTMSQPGCDAALDAQAILSSVAPTGASGVSANPSALPPRSVCDAAQGASNLNIKGRPEAPSTAHVASTFRTTITFSRFAACLPRWILQTGTPFAAFLAASFDMPWVPAPPPPHSLYLCLSWASSAVVALDCPGQPGSVFQCRGSSMSLCAP